MRRRLIAAAVAPALLAGSAHASVTVFGGGLAEDCSRAAQAGLASVQAERTCTAAIEREMLSPHDRAGTFVNRGVLRLRRKDWANARKDFDDAIRIRPGLGEAYVDRGATAIDEGRFDQGLPDLTQGIALGTEDPAKAYFNRAVAYEGLGDVKSAYFDYQKAAALSPDWAAPRQELSRFKVSVKGQ